MVSTQSRAATYSHTPPPKVVMHFGLPAGAQLLVNDYKCQENLRGAITTMFDRRHATGGPLKEGMDRGGCVPGVSKEKT